MRSIFLTLAAGAAALAAVLAQAQSTAPAAPADGPPLQAQPAPQSPAALHASILGSARAGARIVAVGDHGTVLLSDDGGKTVRQARSVPVDATLTEVAFADDKHGWAVGHWGVILATADGGETWEKQRLVTDEDRPLFSVHFSDAQHGVAVGLWSLVLATDDGGQHWRSVELAPPEGSTKADLNLFGLFVNGKGQLFAPAERGMVLCSDDRGQHWRYLSTGYKGSFWTGTAAADGALLVAGLRGSMYRSADDGATWQRIETQGATSITTLLAAGDEVLAVGLDGLVLRSRDRGASFVADPRTEHVDLTAAVARGDRLTLYSANGALAPRGLAASAK